MPTRASEGAALPTENELFHPAQLVGGMDSKAGCELVARVRPSEPRAIGPGLLDERRARVAIGRTNERAVGEQLATSTPPTAHAYCTPSVFRILQKTLRTWKRGHQWKPTEDHR